MNKVFISLGSNLGDRIANLTRAYQEIELRIGRIHEKSSFYETPPWGFESTEPFINSIIRIETEFEIEALLKHLKGIEKEMGRKKKDPGLGYQDRLIDLDIIDFNQRIYESEFVETPHARMHLRNFVIFPMNEIAPKWIHPVLKTSIKTLKEQLGNNEDISKLEHLID